jgi:hypothetical protein
VDKAVYETERHAIGGCPDSLVVVANQGIFGQGVFSMKGEAIARQVGRKRIQPYHIRIARPKGTVLYDDGVRRNGVSKAFMPKSLTDEYHPGGNSLCYSIQTAHLMGIEKIYCLGFTLKSGSRYFFGTEQNPVTKRASIYDTHRALDWLAWFQASWPGRAHVTEGWDGPVYDVLPKLTNDELRERFEPPSSGSDEPDSEPPGARDVDVERLRQDRGDQPVHWLL